LNEGFLDVIGSRWDDIFFNEDKLKDLLRQDFSGLKNKIKKEFEDSNLFAIKDPRIAFLFPVYKRVLEELDIDIKVIIPFRNPLEVANSLNARDNISSEKGVLLWLYYFLLAEKFSREYERVFIGFNDLVSNSKGVVEMISERLCIDFNQKYADNAEQINSFIEPDLKHHNLAGEDLPEGTVAIVHDILSIQSGFNNNDDEIAAKFDSLRKEFFDYQKLFYNREVISAFSDLKSVKKNLSVLEKELLREAHGLEQNKLLLTDAQEVIEQKKQQFEESEVRLQQKTQEMSKVRQQLEAIRLQFENAGQELDYKNHQIENSKQELSEANLKMRLTSQELDSVKHRLNAIEQSLAVCELQLNEKEKIALERSLEINIFKDELMAIYSGKIWKVMRMLKKIKRMFK
jgi:hypothetical protein